MTPAYQAFLASKAPKPVAVGIEPGPMPAHMFDYQVAATQVCIRQGRAALFLDTGLGLLYKQLQKDSTRSRQGMADYVLVFRAPGENAEPVGQDAKNFPVDQWQKWASPVWMDIRQTNTLNVQQARNANDTKHICPLQLDLVERAILLWSNPGDVVLSPFMGIGSEGVSAVKLRRKFLGVELKDEYFAVSRKNLAGAEANAVDLFA
jgi:hypothetical protein